MYRGKVLMEVAMMVVVVMLSVSVGGFGERVSFEGEKEAEGADGEETASSGFDGFGILEFLEFGLQRDGEAVPGLLSEVKLLCEARARH